MLCNIILKTILIYIYVISACIKKGGKTQKEEEELQNKLFSIFVRRKNVDLKIQRQRLLSQ